MAESSGSKTDTLIKLVLVFFISLLSFTVGTFVGKQFSDSQHKFAMLESGYDNESASRSTASIPPDATAMKPTSALSDEDIARLAEELEMEESDREPQSTKAEMEMKEKAVDKVTATVVEGKTVQDVPKPIPADKKVTKVLPKDVTATTIGKFTVQIAAFGTEGEAEKQSADLKKKGYSAFYVPAVVNGKTWYRVSVGVFANRGEAMTYRKKFLAETDISSAIVQKIRK